MNWLETLLKCHSEVETPRSFWWWGALATVSAVVKDNVWIDRAGHYNLYPNIYVMLYADSGLKKGPPVSLAKRLVKQVNNTRIINGRSSIQGIMKELGTAYTVPGGKVISKSVGFLAASEFSSALVESKEVMNLLTDLYDRNYNEGEWKHLLKMEQFSLKDPTLTILVATNEAHLDEFLEQKDIKGGFIGRMFVIHESEPQCWNPLVHPLTDPYKKHEEVSVEYLRKIGELKGQFRGMYDDNKVGAAGRLFEDWYMKFYRDMKESGFKDETGTVGRFGDSVLKVAMNLALAKQPELTITEETMMEAIENAEKLIGGARQSTYKKGKSTNAAQISRLLEILVRRETHSISRKQLLKQYWSDGNAKEWDTVIETLHQGGWITLESLGGELVIGMNETQIMGLKDFMSSRRK